MDRPCIRACEDFAHAGYPDCEALLIIEVDGEQHFDNANYDASRSDALAAHGYRVVRYWNNDVMSKTEDVLADIQNKLSEQSLTPSQPPPSAARKGEG